MKQISYKNAIQEIEEILAKLENQELDVDELSGNLKKVSELIQVCKQKLHKAEDEVDKILDEIKE